MRDVIFIRMPRCGSTSMSSFRENIGFSAYGGVNMRFWGAHTDKNKLVSTNSNTRLPLCVREYVGEEEYDNSLTFSTVRNPFSRAVSMWQHSSWVSKTKSFEDFCKKIEKGDCPSPRAKWHACSTYYHLFDTNGQQLVDYICKLESLQEDVDAMFLKEGLPAVKIPIKNKSKNPRTQNGEPKHYTEWYTPELKDIISKKYEKDIEFFEYVYGE